MSLSNAEGRADLALEDYLRIPYVIESYSVEDSAGCWLRRVEHPELPECAVDSLSVVDAMCALKRRRVEVITELYARGARIPAPRPPLPPETMPVV